MKRFNTRINVKDASLLTSTVTTGEFSIAAFASGAGLLVGIALSGTGRFFSLAIAITQITQKFFKVFTVKQENYDAIKLLALS